MHVSELCYSTETCFTRLLFLPRYTSSFLVFLPFSLAPFLPIYFSAFLPYFLSTFPLPSFLLILLSFRQSFLSLFLYLLPFFLLFHPFCLFIDASFPSYLSSLSRLFLILLSFPPLLSPNAHLSSQYNSLLCLFSSYHLFLHLPCTNTPGSLFP